VRIPGVQPQPVDWQTVEQRTEIDPGRPVEHPEFVFQTKQRSNAGLSGARPERRK
jgi:hypothetical protein